MQTGFYRFLNLFPQDILKAILPQLTSHFSRWFALVLTNAQDLFSITRHPDPWMSRSKPFQFRD